MLDLDLESRRFEIENLSRGSAAALRRGRDCGRMLLAADLADERARAQLLERSRVPDDYSSAARVFGLYALTSIPFASGVKRWENETLAAFAAPPRESSRVRYAPPAVPLIARETVAALLARANSDPLG